MYERSASGDLTCVKADEGAGEFARRGHGGLVVTVFASVGRDPRAKSLEHTTFAARRRICETHDDFTKNLSVSAR